MRTKHENDALVERFLALLPDAENMEAAAHAVGVKRTTMRGLIEWRPWALREYHRIQMRRRDWRYVRRLEREGIECPRGCGLTFKWVACPGCGRYASTAPGTERRLRRAS